MKKLTWELGKDSQRHRGPLKPETICRVASVVSSDTHPWGFPTLLSNQRQVIIGFIQSWCFARSWVMGALDSGYWWGREVEMVRSGVWPGWEGREGRGTEGWKWCHGAAWFLNSSPRSVLPWCFIRAPQSSPQWEHSLLWQPRAHENPGRRHTVELASEHPSVPSKGFRKWVHILPVTQPKLGEYSGILPCLSFSFTKPVSRVSVSNVLQTCPPPALLTWKSLNPVFSSPRLLQ